LDLTGDKVLPMAPKISQAVLTHFPIFRNQYAGLPAELISYGLPGADRAQGLSKQLVQILDRDASDAPITLGAEEASLVDNLSWARDVQKALENGLGKEAKEAATLCSAIESLPKIGALQQLSSTSATERAELQEFLSREDFFTVAADIRNRLTGLRSQVKTAAQQLTAEVQGQLVDQQQNIESLPEWTALPAEDRSEFSTQLSSLALPAAEDMHGINQLLTRRMEVDSAIGLVRGAVLDRHRKLNQEQVPTPASPIPVASAVPTTSENPVSSPRKISVRRRYTLSDQPALSQTIANLQTSLGDLQSRSITEVSVDLE
jgi:hypothetical protein